MIPASSLSTAAYNLRQLFLQNIAELEDIDHIRIGHPADNLKELEATDHDCLNLFFYDVVYDGFPADGQSENPYYVRMHCLITAISHMTAAASDPDLDRDISKGENELRLIGEVMRIMHQQPLLSIADSDDNEVGVLQLVPHAMNLDNLNHIWSTQSDVSYRLSVAYEMALAPIPNTRPKDLSPVSDTMQLGAVPFGSTSTSDNQISLIPEVEFLEVDTDAEDWIPHIAYAQKLAADSFKLHYVYKVTGSLSTALDILIAGKAGGEVKLYWNVWRRKDDNSIVAWQEDIADTRTPPEKTIKSPADDSDPFDPATVDPDNVNAKSLFKAKLPDAVRESDTKSWQAMLVAVHEWKPEDSPDNGDSVTTPIKSNTIFFYGGSS